MLVVGLCTTVCSLAVGAAIGKIVPAVAAVVLISGFGESGNPTELAHALIDHGARDLTLVNNNAGNGHVGLAALLGSYPHKQVDRICRNLTCSNPQRKTTVWLVRHQDRLAEPQRVTLADLKLLMAGEAFEDLLALFKARLAATGRGDSLP